MAEIREPQELKVNTFLRMLFAKNELKVKDVAEAIGKTPENVQNTLSHGRLNIATLMEIMEACGEPLVIQLKSGEIIKLSLTEKK